MKKFYLTITLFIIAIIFISNKTICASEVEALILKGNEHYQNNQFENAIAAYEQILEKGYLSGALHYNLGNSYFRIGRLGKAILNYEKALKLSHNDEDVLYNLNVARVRTIDQIQEVPQIFLVEWWNILITSLSLTSWSFVVLIIYILLLLFIGIYFISKSGRIQRIVFLLGSFNFVVLIISALLLFANVKKENLSNFGILIDSTITVKIAPDSKSNDAFVIHEGVKFKVDDEVNEWSKIILTDGKVGWLPNNSFEMI